MQNEHAMTVEPPERGALNGAKALDLYFKELASNVQVISQQSILLVQALRERATLLAGMAEQAEVPQSLDAPS